MSSSSSSSSIGHVHQSYLSASSHAGGDEPINWPYYLPSTHELAAAAAAAIARPGGSKEPAAAGSGEEEEEEAAPWALECPVTASGRRNRRRSGWRGMDPMVMRLLGDLGADGRDYNYEWERSRNGAPGCSSFSMMQGQELVGEEAPPPDPVVPRPVVELGFDLNLPAPAAVGFEFDLNEPAPEAVAAEEEEEERDPAPAAN